MNILSQVFGAFALIFWIASIQIKEKKKMLSIQNIANVFYAIQYFLLGIPLTASMNLVSILRNIVYEESEKKNKKNSILILLIFVSIIAFLGLISFNNVFNLIPIGITIAYTYGTWKRNTKAMRWTIMICSVIWIYYNASVRAYISIIGNLFELISGIISIIRFDLSKRKKVMEETNSNHN